MNIYGVLERSARSHYGGDPVFTFENEARSFAALRERAHRLAGGLHGQGVRPGDRVAVLLGNRHEWPEVLFGLAALGAVCVPVNVLLTGREIRHVCTDSDVRALVYDALGEAKLAELDALPELLVRVGGADAPEGARVVDYEDLFGEPGPSTGPALGDVLIHYYSSGTTGPPKAAVHTHDTVL